MNAVLESVVPLFTAIFLGYAAGRGNLLDDSGVRGLNAFIFNFAIPPLLFRLMARTDIASIQNWDFILGYLGAEAAMFMLGVTLGRLVFKMALAEATIMGFGCAFSNGVLLILPMLLWVYGDEGGVPALLIITVQVLTFSAVTVLLELGRRDPSPGMRRALLVQTARSIATNPVIMATGAGIIAGASGLVLPTVVDTTLSFLGQAAAPAALFALGATLSRRRISGSLTPASVIVGGKLFLHPLLAAVVLLQIPDLDPIWLSAGILFAAGPVGVNVFVFARHYEAGVETASSAILISTALSLLTLTGLLLLRTTL